MLSVSAISAALRLVALGPVVETLAAERAAWAPGCRSAAPRARYRAAAYRRRRSDVTVPLGPSRSPSQADAAALDITTAATAPKTACLASKSGPNESSAHHAGDCGENPAARGYFEALVAPKPQALISAPDAGRRRRLPAELRADPACLSFASGGGGGPLGPRPPADAGLDAASRANARRHRKRDGIRTRATDVAVLGAGPLFDVPVEMLARSFQRVLLIDIAHLWPARRRIAQLHNVETIWRDLAPPGERRRWPSSTASPGSTG